MNKYHIGIGLVLVSAGLQAQEIGETKARTRIVQIQPRGTGSDINWQYDGVMVDSGTRLNNSTTASFDVVYPLLPRWSLEFGVPIPARHDMQVRSAVLAAAVPETIGSVQMMPLTLLLQYNLMPAGKIQPYLGIGGHYTLFSNSTASGGMQNAYALTSDLKFSNKGGWAIQAGADFTLGESWFLNIDVKYLNLKTDISFNTSRKGTGHIDFEINPLILGLGIGKKF